MSAQHFICEVFVQHVDCGYRYTNVHVILFASGKPQTRSIVLLSLFMFIDVSDNWEKLDVVGRIYEPLTGTYTVLLFLYKVMLMD